MIGRNAPLSHSFTLCTAVSEPAASDLVNCARIVFTICILVRIVCSTLLAAGWDCNVGIIQHDESLMWRCPGGCGFMAACLLAPV